MPVPKLWNPDMGVPEACDSVDQLIKWASDLDVKYSETDGYFSRLWFRGHSDLSFELIPRVYRREFRDRAETFWLDQRFYKLSDTIRSEPDAELERKCLNLERTIVGQFIQAGGYLLEKENEIEAYFLARHFGAPTRLFDWSTNPLVALFMAVFDDDDSKSSVDGAVFAIDPTAHLPEREQPFRGILTPDHPYAREAIRVVMAWVDSENSPHILPIRPNTQPGRLERQASCFTMHSYRSKETVNQTLRLCLIPAKEKAKIRTVLSKLSINQFTVYNTLDRLSRELNKAWRI
jgi:hypothetical protein